MRTMGLVVGALGVLLFAGPVSPALAEEHGMQARFGILYSIPTDDLGLDGQTTELDESLGFHASFEYLVTDLIGVEPAISLTNHDVMVSESGFPDLELGEIDAFAVTANVNFHLMREKKFDFFVGPTVGYVSWGDLETDVFVQDLSVDDEFIFGVNVGVDVPLGEGKWGFAGAFNYLFSEVSVDRSSADIGVDPIQLKVGVSYRF